MPKDEFDFEDPLELNGVALLSEEDTSAEMAECFAEEFMRMGYNSKQVLALFRNPHYVGPNLVMQNKGEPFVRDLIALTFRRWGRPILWPEPVSGGPEQAPTPTPPPPAPADAHEDPRLYPSLATVEAGPSDPLGNPAPKLNL